MYGQPTSEEYKEAWLEAERNLAVNGFQVLNWWVGSETLTNPREDIPSPIIPKPANKKVKERISSL